MTGSVERFNALGRKYESDMLALLEELVNVNSFSGNREGLIRVGELIQDKALEMGLELERILPDDDPEGPFNLLYRGSAPVSGGFGFIGLIGHFDTVHPPESGFSGLVRQGPRLHGPGAQDMKSGLVCGLYAVKILSELLGGPPPLKMILNCDEEIGSVGSRPLIEKEMAGAGAVLVLEGRLEELDRVVTARRGIAGAWVEVFGRAAHASLGAVQGASAVLEMARKVAELDRLNDLEAGTTVSTGVIQGGTVMNTIPDYCRAEVDIRFADSKAGEAVCSGVRKILETNSVPGTTTKYKLVTGRPAMVASPESLELAKDFQAAAALFGQTPDIGPAGGGSDANFTGAMGIPTLDGLGPVGGGPHTRDEYVVMSSLLPTMESLGLFIHRLING